MVILSVEGTDTFLLVSTGGHDRKGALTTRRPSALTAFLAATQRRDRPSNATVLRAPLIGLPGMFGVTTHATVFIVDRPRAGQRCGHGHGRG